MFSFWVLFFMNCLTLFLMICRRKWDQGKVAKDGDFGRTHQWKQDSQSIPIKFQVLVVMQELMLPLLLLYELLLRISCWFVKNGLPFVSKLHFVPSWYSWILLLIPVLWFSCLPPYNMSEIVWIMIYQNITDHFIIYLLLNVHPWFILEIFF